MYLSRSTLGVVILMISSLLDASANCKGNQGESPAALEAVRKLVGIYQGTWTLYGIDDKQQVVKKSAWTDKIEAKAPTVKDGKAFVKTKDEMTFEGGATFTLESTEGYLINEDGSAGQRYFTQYGEEIIERELSPGSFSFAVEADARELASIGFINVLQAKHVMVKTVMVHGDQEIDSITRVSTVQWRVGNKVMTKQFVSLQGQHQRKVCSGDVGKR